MFYFRLRKNKIKNFLIILLLIIIAFLVGKNNVGAASYPYIDLRYDTLASNIDSNFPLWKQIIEYLHTYDQDFDWAFFGRNDQYKYEVFMSKKGRLFNYLAPAYNWTGEDGYGSIYLSKSSYDKNLKYEDCYLTSKTDIDIIKRDISQCMAKNGADNGGISIGEREVYSRFNKTADGNYYLTYPNSGTRFIFATNYDIFNFPYYNGRAYTYKYDFKVDDQIIGMNEKVPTFEDWYRGKFEVKNYESSNQYSQIYSFDLITDSKIQNKNLSFEFETEYLDRVSFDSVEYLVLEENEGLYHWKKFEFDIYDSTTSIEDMIESTVNGKYKLEIKGLNLNPDTYKKMLVKFKLKNAINIKNLKYSSDFTLTEKENFFINDIGYLHIPNRFSMGANKYVNFSTNAEYQATIYFDIIDMDKGSLHLDYFDTKTGSFMEYGWIYNYTGEGRKYANVETSINNQKGFWLTLGDLENDSLDFVMIFPYENLYWSYSEKKDNSNGGYFDPEGNIQNGLKPSDDIVTNFQDLNDVFREVRDFFDTLTKPFQFFAQVFAYFYNSLNYYVKRFITTILTLYLSVKIFKMVRKWSG